MRVIAGFLGGRQFASPNGHRTHPMSDKARGAIFNILGDVEGLTVLDAFAGSGALSIEAVSRGAAKAVAIDIDKSAVRTMKESIQLLGINHQVKVIQANASGWSDNNQDDQFDLLLCDPPYDQLQEKLLQKLVKHLKDGGICVLSWPGKQSVLAFDGLELIEQKDYGDNQLLFYKK